MGPLRPAQLERLEADAAKVRFAARSTEDVSATAHWHHRLSADTVVIANAAAGTRGTTAVSAAAFKERLSATSHEKASPYSWRPKSAAEDPPASEDEDEAEEEFGEDGASPEADARANLEDLEGHEGVDLEEGLEGGKDGPKTCKGTPDPASSSKQPKEDVFSRLHQRASMIAAERAAKRVSLEAQALDGCTFTPHLATKQAGAAALASTLSPASTSAAAVANAAAPVPPIELDDDDDTAPRDEAHGEEAHWAPSEAASALPEASAAVESLFAERAKSEEAEKAEKPSLPECGTEVQEEEEEEEEEVEAEPPLASSQSSQAAARAAEAAQKHIARTSAAAGGHHHGSHGRHVAFGTTFEASHDEGLPPGSPTHGVRFIDSNLRHASTVPVVLPTTKSFPERSECSGAYPPSADAASVPMASVRLPKSGRVLTYRVNSHHRHQPQQPQHHQLHQEQYAEVLCAFEADHIGPSRAARGAQSQFSRDGMSGSAGMRDPSLGRPNVMNPPPPSAPHGPAGAAVTAVRQGLRGRSLTPSPPTTPPQDHSHHSHHSHHPAGGQPPSDPASGLAANQPHRRSPSQPGPSSASSSGPKGAASTAAMARCVEMLRSGDACLARHHSIVACATSDPTLALARLKRHLSAPNPSPFPAGAAAGAAARRDLSGAAAAFSSALAALPQPSSSSLSSGSGTESSGSDLMAQRSVLLLKRALAQEVLAVLTEAEPSKPEATEAQDGLYRTSHLTMALADVSAALAFDPAGSFPSFGCGYGWLMRSRLLRHQSYGWDMLGPREERRFDPETLEEALACAKRAQGLQSLASAHGDRRNAKGGGNEEARSAVDRAVVDLESELATAEAKQLGSSPSVNLSRGPNMTRAAHPAPPPHAQPHSQPHSQSHLQPPLQPKSSPTVGHQRPHRFPPPLSSPPPMPPMPPMAPMAPMPPGPPSASGPHRGASREDARLSGSLPRPSPWTAEFEPRPPSSSQPRPTAEGSYGGPFVAGGPFQPSPLAQSFARSPLPPTQHQQHQQHQQRASPYQGSSGASAAGPAHPYSSSPHQGSEWGMSEAKRKRVGSVPSPTDRVQASQPHRLSTMPPPLIVPDGSATPGSSGSREEGEGLGAALAAVQAEHASAMAELERQHQAEVRRLQRITMKLVDPEGASSLGSSPSPPSTPSVVTPPRPERFAFDGPRSASHSAPSLPLSSSSASDAASDAASMTSEAASAQHRASRAASVAASAHAAGHSRPLPGQPHAVGSDRDDMIDFGNVDDDDESMLNDSGSIQSPSYSGSVPRGSEGGGRSNSGVDGRKFNLSGQVPSAPFPVGAKPQRVSGAQVFALVGMIGDCIADCPDPAALFRCYDAHGRGALSYEEFGEAAADMTEQELSPELAARLARAADRKSTGFIALDDFAALATALPSERSYWPR